MTYFPRPEGQVSSALAGLTAVFEMGTGVTPSLESPKEEEALEALKALKALGASSCLGYPKLLKT